MESTSPTTIWSAIAVSSARSIVRISVDLATGNAATAQTAAASNGIRRQARVMTPRTVPLTSATRADILAQIAQDEFAGVCRGQLSRGQAAVALHHAEKIV